MELIEMLNLNNTIDNFDLQLKFMSESFFSNHNSENTKLFNLNPALNFGILKDGLRLSRQKRMSCPGGVGNFGFNSFNFMTFVLLTLNAVANTNNNINNNNNNNIDINYNTINQDSNNVVSNSENMNMVTATILPVPGRRSLGLLNKSLRHHLGKRCAGNVKMTVLDLMKMEVLEQAERIIMEQREECEGLAVCQAIKHISGTFLKDAINTELLEAGENPFLSMISCAKLFPHCVSM